MVKTVDMYPSCKKDVPTKYLITIVDTSLVMSCHRLLWLNKSRFVEVRLKVKTVNDRLFRNC